MLKYEAVLNDLAEKIDNGTYKPNQQLPTIAELCDIYSVSNITVKKALDELALRGMISKRKGSGCYVKGVFAKTASVGQMSGQMAGFSSEAAAKGGTLTSDVLDFSVVHPEAPVAEKLGMSEEDFVYHVCRVRVLDGVPQVVEYTYMPIAKIPGLRLEHVQSSIYTYIEQDLGLKIDSAHRVVRATTGRHPCSRSSRSVFWMTASPSSTASRGTPATAMTSIRSPSTSRADGPVRRATFDQHRIPRPAPASPQ